MSGRRLLLLLLLPSVGVALWWLLSGPRDEHVGPSWIAHGNVFEALINGELVRTTEGWKIISLADTMRREGCEALLSRNR